MESINSRAVISTRQTESRFDGSVWYSYKFNNGNELTLTSRGQELLSYNPKLRGLIRGYISEAKIAAEVKDMDKNQRDGLLNKPPIFRTIFRRGGNSEVYHLLDNGVKSNLLIKEAERGTRPSLQIALRSMDYLQGVCLRELNPLVGIPDHYALFQDNQNGIEYLLIQRIDDGITVQDILRGRVAVDPNIVKAVEADFSQLKKQVITAISNFRERLNIPYKNLLTDWTDANVLVDLKTRSNIRPYTFKIIDQ